MFNMIAVIMEITGFTLPGGILNEVIAMASKGVIAMESRGKTLDIVFQRDEWVTTASRVGASELNSDSPVLHVVRRTESADMIKELEI